MAGVRIEVFSDVICPWCYIGTRRLERAIQLIELEGGARPDVEMHPFQLDPSAPESPSPVADVYAKRFGDRAPALLEHVISAARQDGLTLRFDIAQRANTRRAHRLLEHARETAGRDAQWTLSNLLFRAYFEDGADIGRASTLVALAELAGVAGAVSAIEADDDRVGAAIERASNLGITAVPTFIVDDHWTIPGAQDVETFARVIRRLVT